MRRAFAILALATAVGCLGDPAKHLERAQQLTFERQPALALKEYEEVLSLLAKKDPSKVRPLLVRAFKGAADLCYLEIKDYRKAVEYYRDLTDYFPDAPETLDARANLADIYRGRFGDRAAAVSQLAAIVQTFPKSPEVDRYQYLAAKDFSELSDWNQAIVEARVLLDRYPKSEYGPEAQMLIATAHVAMGQRQKAADAFAQVPVRWPSSDLAPRAKVEQAKLLADAGKLEEAIEVMADALKDHPDPRGVQAELTRTRKRLAAKRRGEKQFERQDVWDESPRTAPPVERGGAATPEDAQGN